MKLDPVAALNWWATPWSALAEVTTSMLGEAQGGADPVLDGRELRQSPWRG